MTKTGPSGQQLRSPRPAGLFAPPARAVGISLLLASLLLLGTAAAHTIRALKAHRTSAVYIVTATAYEAVAGQTDSKPFLTADNSRIPRGYGSHTRWLALSRDLLRPWGGPFAFGDKVRVEGISPALDGEYTVHDTMHPRFRHRLDVLAHPREHLSLSQPGVKLRRVSAASENNSRHSRSADKAQVKTKATHRSAQSHRKTAKKPVTRTKPARISKKSRRIPHPASVAHRKHNVAKKPLTTLPKRSQKKKRITHKSR